MLQGVLWSAHCSIRNYHERREEPALTFTIRAAGEEEEEEEERSQDTDSLVLITAPAYYQYFLLQLNSMAREARRGIMAQPLICLISKWLLA